MGRDLFGVGIGVEFERWRVVGRGFPERAEPPAARHHKRAGGCGGLRMADNRKLEKTRTPGIYRRHADGCDRKKKACGCPYVVVWRDHERRQRKQLFPTLDLARAFKGELDSGKGSRRPR